MKKNNKMSVFKLFRYFLSYFRHFLIYFSKIIDLSISKLIMLIYDRLSHIVQKMTTIKNFYQLFKFFTQFLREKLLDNNSVWHGLCFIHYRKRKVGNGNFKGFKNNNENKL